METNYIATFVLHSLGDTIGFKNGDWEFNYNKQTTLDTINEYIFEFIDLGGINGIDIKDWKISDDTLYHIAIAKSLLKYKNKFNKKFSILIKENLVEMHNKMVVEKKKGILRYPGKTTIKYIEKFTEDIDARDLPYDKMTGGNGCAMRNLCIGLGFYKSSDIDKLIEFSILSSKLTHNSPLGFLAGFSAAFFVSLAIQQVNVDEWIFKMIDVVESDKIKKYIGTSIEENMDYMNYIRYWKKYIDTRFVDKKPIKTRSTSNMIFRIKYYYQNFVMDSHAEYIGGSGFCALIMAYDALLDCDGKWEKLVFYSMLHPGDSDTVGSIAGGLYGALYGFGDVPNNLLCCIEEKNTTTELGKKFYKKYY